MRRKRSLNPLAKPGTGLRVKVEYLTGVGERSSQRRSCTVRSSGATRRANVGMSSEKASENLARRKPKVS